MSSVAPMLLCEDLVVGHAGHAVMSGVNIDLAPGKILAIVGPSGCGKSTLMRVLGGLDEPMAGRSELLGTDPVSYTHLTLPTT
jgi:ABC-type glutathione transport system ATPase component